jgi:hypothetical protein
MWMSHTIIKVNKVTFGRLLAVTKPGSAFFSQRGSFISHGFREISVQLALREAPGADYSEVDEISVRLYQHRERSFRRDSTFEDIVSCFWEKGQ